MRTPAFAHRRTLPLAVLAGLAAALLAWVACGDDGPSGRAGETIVVDVVDLPAFAFSPAVVNARVGDTIRWVQRGVVPHTVTEGVRGSPTPGGFDEQVVETGDVVEVRMTRAGTIDYFCRPHFGMDGQIVVSP